jgi:cell shape-determining protein MreC
VLRIHPLARAGLVAVALVLLIVIVKIVISRTVKNIPIVSSDTAALTLNSKRALRSKVTELETTIASYDARLTALSALADENNKLKAELGRTPPPKGVLAHAITVPDRSFYATFVIDAGSAEHVSVGQTAYAFGNIALGTIASVEEHSATVELYSASGRETAGTAEGSEVAVTLIGRGAGEYEVRMPRNIPFDIGSSILEQSVHTAILATIEKVITDPRDPFQRLLAKAPVNLAALKWVIVR